jgi:hypothetical protein
MVAFPFTPLLLLMMPESAAESNSDTVVCHMPDHQLVVGLGVSSTLLLLVVPPVHGPCFTTSQPSVHHLVNIALSSPSSYCMRGLGVRDNKPVFFPSSHSADNLIER